jgi:hypothetical protein
MIVSRDHEYEQLPMGLQPAVCVTYYDIGYQRGYNDKPQHKVVILFELEAKRQDGTRFTATKKYTATLGEKANLLKDLQSWRGVAFTADELKGFNLDNIKGKRCQLNMVSIVKGNGDPSVIIDSVLPPPRAWQGFIPETAPDYVPEWVLEALEAQLPPPDGRRRGAAPQGVPDDDFTDDIPF